MIAVFDNNHGHVEFDTRTGRTSFRLQNFRPFATHAIHIHEFGDMSDGCKSLGGHYNPTNSVHGRHVGDLIFNFQTDKNGRFVYSYDSPNITNDILGRSVVIHEGVDDLGMQGRNGVSYTGFSTDELHAECTAAGYKVGRGRNMMLNKLMSESLITGNAGRRLACAVIGRKNHRM